jgi:hypothetical protein
MAKLHIASKIAFFIVLIVLIVITGMCLRKAGIIQENFTKRANNRHRAI